MAVSAVLHGTRYAVSQRKTALSAFSAVLHGICNANDSMQDSIYSRIFFTICHRKVKFI